MYNIHALYLTDTQQWELLEHLKRLRPPLVLVMDRASFAKQVKQALPSTTVVYRRSGDDNVHTHKSPDQWLSEYASEVAPNDNLYLYCNNEPGFSDEMLTHAYECGQLALSRGYKACLLNLSVGIPEPADWKRSASRRVLDLCGRNRDKLLIGLHEYFATFSNHEFGFSNDPASWPAHYTGISWLISRYRNVFKACDEMGVARPKIAITEFGSDYIHAVQSWQQGLPHTPGYPDIGALWANREAWQQGKPSHLTWEQYFVESCHWCWRAIYRDNPEIAGIATFCWGAQGGSRWEMYNHQPVYNIMSLMESKDWTLSNTTPTPIPPDPTPTPTPNPNTLWNSPVNIRTNPGTNNPVIGVIPVGGKARVFPDQPKYINPYVWIRVQYQNVIGYSACVQANTYSVLPESETPATPAPAPDDGEPSIRFCDGFDQPVGSAEDRASSEVWAGGWIDANPFLNLTPGKSYHTGSDLNWNPPGHFDSDKLAPFYACADGVVLWAQSFRVWGNIIVIKHPPLPDGTVMYSRYAHSETIEVRTGDTVKRGQQLGLIGNAYNPDMPYHLHFDIVKTAVLEHKPTDWPGLDRARVERTYVNPREFIWKNRPKRT